MPCEVATDPSSIYFLLPGGRRAHKQVARERSSDHTFVRLVTVLSYAAKHSRSEREVRWMHSTFSLMTARPPLSILAAVITVAAVADRALPNCVSFISATSATERLGARRRSCAARSRRLRQRVGNGADHLVKDLLARSNRERVRP